MPLLVLVFFTCHRRCHAHRCSCSSLQPTAPFAHPPPSSPSARVAAQPPPSSPSTVVLHAAGQAQFVLDFWSIPGHDIVATFMVDKMERRLPPSAPRRLLHKIERRLPHRRGLAFSQQRVVVELRMVYFPL